MQFLDPSKHCSFHCLRHQSNLTTIDLIEESQQGGEIDTVEEFDRFI